MKNRAFTLAEVLITLGIIGIVAAMTIPVLYGKFTTVVYQSKCKKFQAVMAEAIKLSTDQYGTIDGWTVERPADRANSQKNSEQLAKRLLPYLKVSEDCAFKPNCMLAVDYKNSDGSRWNTYTNYRDEFYYKVILLDGSHVIIKAQGEKCTYKHGRYSNTCGYFIYDVNGSNKPNQMDKDACVYEITSDSLIPAKF